jgi:hypothetical protein
LAVADWFVVIRKVFPNGEVIEMLNSKSCRMLFAFAASATISQVSWAGCNCSAPPSPSISTGVMSPAPWSGGVPYYGNSPGSISSTAYGASQYGYGDYNAAGPHWAPGGYEPRVGSPVYYHDPAGGQYVSTGNPYYDHFGPGYQRSSLYGHYRFPYYNYRAPWYFPGKAVYNRDTNLPW